METTEASSHTLDLERIKDVRKSQTSLLSANSDDANLQSIEVRISTLNVKCLFRLGIIKVIHIPSTLSRFVFRQFSPKAQPMR